MTARWWAPGRATLIGDHTDYTGGWALPFALDRGVSVTLTLTVSGTVTVRSAPFGQHEVALSQLRPGRSGWARYVEGAVHLLRTRGAPLSGVEVTVTSDLPSGGGLASSAAVVCGVLGAAAEACGMDLTRLEAAQLARRVETEYVGAPVGFMDPAVIMQAEAGHALLIDCTHETAVPVPLRLREAGLELIVADTGEGHRTSGAIYAERVSQCAEAARGLGVASLREVSDVERLTGLADVVRRRARHVVTENARVLTAAQAAHREDWSSVGALMLESHESLRDDYEVSTPALDLVVDVAMGAGALGARLTGAGLGGSAIVLAPADRAVAEAIREAAMAAGPVQTRRVAVGGAARSDLS